MNARGERDNGKRPPLPEAYAAPRWEAKAATDAWESMVVVTSYKGPASLDELRMILKNNDELQYMDDEEFLGWARAFRVWRKSDNTVQLLYYASPDGSKDGWRWFQTQPWERYS